MPILREGRTSEQDRIYQRRFIASIIAGGFFLVIVGMSQSFSLSLGLTIADESLLTFSMPYMSANGWGFGGPEYMWLYTDKAVVESTNFTYSSRSKVAYEEFDLPWWVFPLQIGFFPQFLFGAYFIGVLCLIHQNRQIKQSNPVSLFPRMIIISLIIGGLIWQWLIFFFVNEWTYAGKNFQPETNPVTAFAHFFGAVALVLAAFPQLAIHKPNDRVTDWIGAMLAILMLISLITFHWYLIPAFFIIAGIFYIIYRKIELDRAAYW